MKKQESILRCIVTLFVICLPMLKASSQVIEITAPDEVLEKEAFQVRYDVVSSVPIEDMPRLVDMNDVELLGEPVVSHSSPAPLMGRKNYILRVECTFKSKKTGKIKIPRVELTIEGKKVLSNKKTIQVRQLPEMGDVDCFVKVHTTKNSIKVGDTLTITYKLYTTQEVARILRINASPIKGFRYQDLSPRSLTFEEENVDGVTYKVYTIRKYLLQSLSLGTWDFLEGSIELEYTYPTGRIRRDSWGREYEEQLRETKSCPIAPTTIRVHDMIAI